MKKTQIHISLGNTKVGKMFNFSLPPGISCSAIACATCHKQGCYACKSYRQYPNVRAAWNENYILCKYNLAEAEKQITAYLEKNGHKSKFFRIHVSGDFFSREYFDMWERVAARFPAIRFLAFTKFFENISADVPENFTLRLSDWPGVTLPEDLAKVLPVAYVDDGTRPADTFANAYKCPGNCRNCKHCFARKGDTVFAKH